MSVLGQFYLIDYSLHYRSFPCLLVSDWMLVTVFYLVGCWIFLHSSKVFLSFYLGWSSVTWKCFLPKGSLCSLCIFWSSALTAARYSPPLNQDLPEDTLYQLPKALSLSPAAGGRHHSWLSLFLLTFSDGSLLRHWSTLLNIPGDPLLIFGVSLFAAVCCLVLSPKNVADLVPGHAPFSFLRGICQASS